MGEQAIDGTDVASPNLSRVSESRFALTYAATTENAERWTFVRFVDVVP